MKIGIVADIHECTARLALALDQLRAAGAERFVVLGDVADVCVEVNETVSLLRDVNAIGVWGNHDYELCINPPPELACRLGEETADFLRSLRDRLKIGECLFTHVEPWRDTRDENQLWQHDGTPDSPERAMRSFSAADQRVLFFGHIHRWSAATPMGPLDWSGSTPLDLDPERRYLISIDSVSNGSCALYDSDEMRLTPFWAPRPAPKSAAPAEIAKRRASLLELLEAAHDILAAEPSHVEVGADLPILFVGDTHGDTTTTRALLDNFRTTHRLVFCGDYVDRAPEPGGSLKNIELLLAAKVRHPEKLILLRGNHEFRRVFRDEGFGDALLEIDTRERVLTSAFERVFSQLPYVATMSNGVVAMHGGLPDFTNPAELLELPKGIIDFIEHRLVSQTVNNDNVPSNDAYELPASGQIPSTRVFEAGFSLLYGEPYFSQKMKMLGASVLVRGHDFRVKGLSLQDRVVTLMSAEHYADRGPVTGILIAHLDPTATVTTGLDLRIVAWNPETGVETPIGNEV